MMATDVFSCDYDAPMYVDFASMDAARMEDDMADAWFDAAAAKEAGQPLGEDEMFATGCGIADEEEVEGPVEVAEEQEEAEQEESVPRTVVEQTQCNATPGVTRTKPHGMVLRASVSSASKSQIPRRPLSASKKPKLTMPETPDFVRRGRQRMVPLNGDAAKTSEELELERISKLREERRKVVQASQESFRQLQTTSSTACASLPKRAAVAPTIPVGFNFRTESRLAKNGAARPAEGSHGDGPGQFTRQLRSYNNAGGKGPVKASHPAAVTQPKPFKFHQTSSHSTGHDEKENGPIKPGGAAAKYVSAAEHLRKFHSATPDRFRTLPRSELNKGPIQTKNAPKNALRMTMPITPKLTSKNRSRPVVVESLAEKEEKQAEEIKQYKFKASKFDPRIVSENGSYGLPKRATPKTTVPVALRLQTSKRCDERVAKAGACSSPAKLFRAQPIPDEMFEHPLGVPERAPAAVTDARTPKIRKSKRKAEEILEAQAKRVIQENEEPHGMTPPRNTVFQPFDLQTDVRGAHKVEQWKYKLAAEEEANRKAMQFHARPSKTVYEPAFVPEPSHRGPTVPADIRLNSDARAEKRQEFDEMLNDKELEVAEEQYRRKLENEDKEKEEVERLRAAMVHKAMPVRHYKAVDVKPSVRPLTKPASPSFSERITIKYQRGRTPQQS